MDVEARAHANLVEFIRFLGRLDETATLLDEPGIFGIRGAMDFPSTRIAIPQGASPLAPRDFADRASDFLFADGGKTACAYVRTDDQPLHDELTGRGFV